MNFCTQNRALICFLCQKIKEKRPADIRLHVMMEASSVVLTGYVGRNLLEREACRRSKVANKVSVSESLFVQLLSDLLSHTRAMCVPELGSYVAFSSVWVMFIAICVCEKSYLVALLRKLCLHLHWHFSLEN